MVLLKKAKRYYVCIFIFALLAGLILRDLNKSKFAVIRSSEAYAPIISEEVTDDMYEEKININTASKELLTTLNGIGDKLAERIIAYRQTKGMFETIQDIMKVNGIGDSLFDKIKDDITVK